MTDRSARCAIGLSCALLLAVGSAHASPYDVFGFNPRAIAMGGAQTAAADDYTATYYNPAALTVDKRVSFGLGVMLSWPTLFVDRGDNTSERGTLLPDEHYGITLGWQYPLGGIFEDQVALGISAYLPTDRLVHVQGAEPQRPQFYMYQNLHDKLIIALALAYEPWPWLSIGAGAQVLADLTGGADLRLDVLARTFERSGIEVSLAPTVAPVFGIHARPVEGLSLGLSWRSVHSLSFTFPVVVAEGDVFALDLDVSQTVLWTPHQLSFGAAYAIPDTGVTVSTDATLAFWSGAPDPSPRFNVDIGGKLLDGFGLGEAIDVSARSELLDLGFVDTVTTRLGVEWQTLPWLRLRAGYFFRPTPAPRASGVTAYLDNDAHVASIGAGFVFEDPLDVAKSPVEVDVALQTIALPRRTVYRPDPADPVGDLSHGGAIWTLALSINHRY